MLDAGCWMKEANIIVDQSYAFALKIMSLVKLIRQKRERLNHSKSII